jgi:hypothetical protein
MSSSELSKLVAEWVDAGKAEQESFDWSRSQKKWARTFFDHSDFILGLPPRIDRKFVRSIMESDVSIADKFLTVMIWGYGDIGYGPYRVNRMLESSEFETKISKSYEIAQSGTPLLAYDYLSKNRIQLLGPSFGTKWISFATPKNNPAPIYDSFIAKWIDIFASDEFNGVSTNPENWNLKTYTAYYHWLKKMEAKFAIGADTLEYIIFTNALVEFS